MNIAQPINRLQPQGNYVPKWMSTQALYCYVAALIVATGMYMSYAIEWYLMLVGVVSVVGFFYYSNYLSKRWARLTVKTFTKRLIVTSFSIRLIYTLFSYWFYYWATGEHFEWHPGDVVAYHAAGEYVVDLVNHGNEIWDAISTMYRWGSYELSDRGYVTYLALQYTLLGTNLLITRILKCVWSTWTVVMMYHLASRQFGEGIGRLTGIFCMLMPNMIYYCGLHLKEVEMVFLAVAAIDQADQVMRLRKFNVWKILPMLLCVLALFTFRTVLGAVVILALGCALTLSSTRIVSWGKRIIMILLAGGLLLTMMGGRLEQEVREITNQDIRAEQRRNMEWRAGRTDSQGNANQFAKYAGAAVFAPLITTIPFPTMVATPDQENQRMIHGGNFVKNILSGFVVFAIFCLLFSGDWRRYVLSEAYYAGYLVVLVFSNFAQSERFHMPIMPFMLMFAAYGMSRFL
ncbi:MAG: hypothetical protein MJZ89_01035 [Paludibacteraceae bacterium]|nr:hypothetical protein [Paludibacteraceae bacterium]